MYLKRISFFFLISFISLPGLIFSQPCTKIVSGHKILTPTSGCVPFTFQIQNLYSNSTPDTEYTVDWGDGTIEVLQGSLDPGDYTPDFSHVYLPNTSNTNCGYRIVIEATNACTDPEDARFEVTVSVWDTDQRGLAIAPSVVNVCQGNAATVNFADATDWNCNPKVANENNGPRHIQWEYLGGTIDVPPAGTAGVVIPVSGAGTPSDNIYVPAINPNTGAPFNIGDEFTVRLNYWNYCNPYDDPSTPYSPDPDAGDPGESPPVSTTAVIRIVEAPDPGFKIFDAGGAEKYSFCIDDLLFPQPDASGLIYTWEFYDDESGATLLETRTGSSPQFSYTTGGRKLVRLRVQHQNVVGSCETTSDRIINIFPVASAAIRTTDVNDVAITPVFCKDPSGAFSAEVKFTDVSLNPDANTRWRWEFYDNHGALYRTEPGSGAINNPGSSFTETYTSPGVYRVKLILWDQTVPFCTSEDEALVYVYESPQADFSFSSTCNSTLVEFTDNAQLATVINGDKIQTWEWDFDYDGAVFTPDQTFTGLSPGSFTHDFGAPGTYEVALRTTTEKGACPDVVVKTVHIVAPAVADISADVSAGCAPLEATFTNESAGNQPAGIVIAEYRWLIDEGSGFVEVESQDPADPLFTTTYSRTFVNNTNHVKIFRVKLAAETSLGCEVESAVETIEVYPQIQTNISSDYNLLNDNCSPLGVNFTANLLDPGLMPDEYNWTIEDAGGVVDVISVTGSPDFYYEFSNTNNAVKNFIVTLNVVKTNYCFKPSSQNIVLNPTPSSGFTADLVEEACNFVTYRLTADQDDLNYSWKINAVEYISQSFEVSFPRPESHEADQVISVELSTLDPNTNCESVISSQNLIAPKKESVRTVLNVTGGQNGCIPLTAAFTNESVDFPAGTLFEVWVSKDGEGYRQVSPSGGDVNSQFKLDFDSAGVYQVELRANTPSGCIFVSTPSQIISAYDLPESLFTTDKTEGCAPLQVNFTNHSIGADGPGSGWYIRSSSTSGFELFSTETHPSHTFNNHTTGTIIYEAAFIAETRHGCRDTLTREIKVLPGVKPEFMISPVNQGCSPLDLIFNNMNVKANTTYVWNWGDGEPEDTTFLENQLEHTFNNLSASVQKTYNVVLTATDNASGCINQTAKPVRVYPDIQVNVVPDVPEGCAPFTVNFTNESIGVSDHVWYYRIKGEEDKFEMTSSESIDYLFENKTSEEIIYEVVYEASNSYGCTKTETFDIKAYPEINAYFTANPLNQSLPNSTVSIYNATNAGNWTYSWDYGDGKGTEAVKDPPAYVYETYGVYEIKLVVSNGPCKSDYSRTVVIDPVPPVVDFDCDPKKGCRPLTVRFKNLSTFADEDSYSWDFGDNQGSSSAKEPVYTYTEPGIYSVSLTASNKLGKSVVKEKKYLIEVYDNPYAKFEVRPRQVYIPDMPVNVTNFTFGADTYQWEFGDGAVYQDYEPEHYYKEAGEYNITLIAQNDKGCADTVVVESAAEAIEGGRIHVPNVFTPSPDGPSGGISGISNANDIFLPLAEGVVEYRMQVFNRWGEMLFESFNKEVGWDGYHRGKLCQQDVYIYKIALKFADGERTVKVGDVTLLR